VIPGGQQVLCVDCIWQPCVLDTRDWLNWNPNNLANIEFL